MVEQRRSKRFEINLPVKLVRNGMRPIAGSGQTKNLSSGGVLFGSDTRLDVGEAIEYVISLAPSQDSGPVALHCLGKVTRVEPPIPEWQAAGLAYQVAATLERYEFVRSRD